MPWDGGWSLGTERHLLLKAAGSYLWPAANWGGISAHLHEWSLINTWWAGEYQDHLIQRAGGGVRYSKQACYVFDVSVVYNLAYLGKVCNSCLSVLKAMECAEDLWVSLFDVYPWISSFRLHQGKEQCSLSFSKDTEALQQITASYSAVTFFKVFHIWFKRSYCHQYYLSCSKCVHLTWF